MLMVLVGALNVSSISTVALGEITSGEARHWSQSALTQIERGAEIGRFNLGSTVVIVFARQLVTWNGALKSNDKLTLGSAIGTLQPAS